jgi:hypothetical protein
MEREKKEKREREREMRMKNGGEYQWEAAFTSRTAGKTSKITLLVCIANTRTRVLPAQSWYHSIHDRHGRHLINQKHPV